MKNSLKLFLVASIMLAASVSMGQIRIPDNVAPAKPADKMMSAEQTQEYVYMKSGSVMLHKDGKETPLAEIYTCTNGTTVSPDGTVTKKDGTRSKLGEGDRILSNGKTVESGSKPSDY